MTKAETRPAFPLPLDKSSGLVRDFILKLDRPHRHHGRDRVLVDQLRLAVAAQETQKLSEPGDIALKLDAR